VRPAVALLLALAACAFPAREPARPAFTPAPPAPTPPPPDPLFAEALARADAAFREERWADAIAAYERALALRGDVAATLHRQIGLAAARLGDHPRALDHLAVVIVVDPGDVEIRSQMAQSAILAGMFPRAFDLLRGMPPTAPADAFYDVAVRFLNAGRPADAVDYFTKALAVAPDHAEATFQRAMACIQLGRTAEARAGLRRFLELEPAGPRREAARRALDQLR
jgi:tetratricopeptide (TPR) repeat protein